MSDNDHRKIGSELELFQFHPNAPGAVIWLDKGEQLYYSLKESMRQVVKEYGYHCINSPLIWKQDLWEVSGHWDNYKENIFHWKDGSEEVGLKPMNCPVHMSVYASKRRAYRELPYRIYEPGILHRNEVSGSLGGLTRLRQFSQDDGHIFCAPDQIQDEILNLLDMINGIYGSFGLDYSLKFSSRPEKAMGDDNLWDLAESSLLEALREYHGDDFEIDEGGGAFYGPKIDCHVKDSLGRSWQLGTIQLDFNLPRRFNLKYRDENDQEQMPVVIHRAILGSFERFIALLLEDSNGKLPFWLSPEQIRVLTISEKSNRYANEIASKLQGFRCSVDDRGERISRKIAEARSQKIPIILVIGSKEEQSNMIGVESRDEGHLGSFSSESLVELLDKMNQIF